MTVQLIDPRGPRFGAAITTIMLVLALVLGPTWGLIPLGLQTVVFALGAFVGLSAQPYGVIFRTAVRPRLAAPTELEDPRPPRFAQIVGLIFAVTALVGGLAGWDWLFFGATAMALAAAFLNAAFDFCLGCEMWTILQRIRGNAVGPRREAVSH